MTSPDLSVLEKLYRSGAWVCLGIVVAFFALRFASTHVAWLQKDHRAAYVSALLGGMATLIIPVSQGTTPTVGMLVAAIGTVVALFSQPKPSLVGVTAPADKQSGFVDLRLIAMLSLIAIGLCACAWFKSESKAIGKDSVSCAKSEAAKAATKEFGPLVDQVLLYATGGDGKINTDQLKTSAASLAIDTGMCVLADRFAAAMNPKPTDPNAPKSSPVEADPASLRAAFDELRTQLAPGKVFQTEHGVL